ncbi:MAG TPA: type II CRISPR-associated endonuclease Cas1 [Ignavibacteria bacterium]|nr:type II CRISPR-associated endonuclease Cas1 [Ignavibacteria bacterium]
MIKRTLYFGNPAYLSFKDEKLVIEKRALDIDQIGNPSEAPENDKTEQKEEDKYLKRKFQKDTISVEDIGIIILDHHGVSTSQYLISKLLEYNVAVIFCNDKHHPTGLLLNLDGNTVQSEKFRAQIKASIPLRKNLWQQTVVSKVNNQAALLKEKGKTVGNMISWMKNVNSGDTKNIEARASVYYWKNLFPEEMEFYRDRFGEPPNNLLNYGYAILRAIVARGLVASGLLPTFGIHHRNKYNAYCLADDIMEPYRPFVDKVVCELIERGNDFYDLTTELKKELLKIPALDIIIDGEKSPLMVGLQRTTASLSKCFEMKSKKIIYPEFAI